MIAFRKYEALLAVGLIISFFLPWVKTNHLNGSAYDITLQLGGHAAILLLIPLMIFEHLISKFWGRYASTFRAIFVLLAFCILLISISQGGTASILFLIPIMATELLTNSFEDKGAKIPGPIVGFLTLGFIGYGAIHLAGEGIKYGDLFQFVTIGVYATAMLALAMMLSGLATVNRKYESGNDRNVPAD